MEAAAKEFAIAAPSRDRTNCFCLGSIRDSRLAACTLAYTRVEAQRDEAERLYSIAVVLVQAGTAHTSMHTPWHNNIWECCCLCTVKLNKGRTAVNGFVSGTMRMRTGRHTRRGQRMHNRHRVQMR